MKQFFKRIQKKIGVDIKGQKKAKKSKKKPQSED